VLQNMISCIIYDLDGTLIDSAGDIAYAVNRVRAHYDLEALTVEHIKCFIGDGAPRLLERAIYGLVEDRSLRPERTLPKRGADAEEVLDRFLSVYAEDPVAHTSVDETVEPSLNYWQKEGVAQAVITNKPHPIAVNVLEQLGLAEFLDVIVGRGSRDDEGTLLPPKPDPANLDFVLDQAGSPAEETWMVGDGMADVQLAGERNLNFAGLSNGYADDEEFAEAVGDPTRLFGSYGELYAFLREEHGG